MCTYCLTFMTDIMTSDPNTRYKEEFARLVTEHGSYHAIPKEEIHVIGERQRAAFVLEAHPEATTAAQRIQVLRQYAIPNRIIEEFVDDVDVNGERRVKRADKYAAITAWAKENPGKTTTVYEIADIAGFSYSTANEFVKDRVDLFRRVKKGEYEIRDVVAERQEAKKP